MDDNPFVDPTDANPFDDPSIQAVAGSATAVIEVDDNNDNPFHESAASSQPITGNIGRSKAQGAADELRARQAELDRKEAELRRRENALNGGTADRPKNWPPLPTWSPIKACFYHDIEVEIPQDFQMTVRRMYHMWLGYVLTLFVNVCVFLIILFAYSEPSGEVTPTAQAISASTTSKLASSTTISTATTTNTTNSTTPQDDSGPSLSRRRRASGTDSQCIDDSLFYNLVMSIVWFIIFAPASMIWYRAIYKAFRDDSSFQFFLFFFIYFFQLIFHIVQAIGANDMGYGGWLQVFRYMSCNVFCGILLVITAVAFTGNAVMCVMQIMRIHDIYRSTGKTLADAQNEWATGVISNPTVQNHAREFASNVIQEQVNSNLRGSN